MNQVLLQKKKKFNPPKIEINIFLSEDILVISLDDEDAHKYENMDDNGWT